MHGEYSSGHLDVKTLLFNLQLVVPATALKEGEICFICRFLKA